MGGRSESQHPTRKWPGQSGEARIFLIQDDNLTAEVPLRRSILQSTLRQKYRSTGRHNPQRDGGPEKGLYRLHPIALGLLPGSVARAQHPAAGQHGLGLEPDRWSTVAGDAADLRYTLAGAAPGRFPVAASRGLSEPRDPRPAVQP